ncbi:MAG: hypothetical protein Q8S02_08420 [Hydrogenophaga sp.]|nr:hypothetical protein [Hydrogenophaga sp.]
MDTADQSSTVQVPSSNPTPALVQAGQVGLAFLRNTGQEQKNQAFQIFCEMAAAAVKYGAQHTNIEYESSALKERIAPNSGKAASAWLSPLWKQFKTGGPKGERIQGCTAHVILVSTCPNVSYVRVRTCLR